VTIFDLIFLSVLVISIIIGWWRGLFHEVLSLAAWILAFILAPTYGQQIGEYFVLIENQTFRFAAGLVATFLAVLIVFWIVRSTLTVLFKKIGLAWLNRGLGVLFGFLRGLLISLLLTLVAGMTVAPATTWWQGALFSPPLVNAAKVVLPFLPQLLQNRIKYDYSLNQEK